MKRKLLLALLTLCLILPSFTNIVYGREETPKEDQIVTEADLNNNQPLIDAVNKKLTNFPEAKFIGGHNEFFEKATFKDLANIKELRISQPISLGKEIGNFKNLEELNIDLVGNIPDELWSLTSLKKLSLNGNQMTGAISEKVGNLTALKELRISNFNETTNQYEKMNPQFTTELPSEIGKLENLRDITFQISDVNDIPGSLEQPLGQVKIICQDSVNIENLPKLNLDSGIFHIDSVKDQGYGNLPEWIANNYLQFLEVYNIKDMQGALERIKSFNSIEVIIFENCGLNEELPEYQGSDLQGTFALKISNCGLTGSTKGKLNQLMTLGYFENDGNEISDLPIDCMSLQQLMIRNNKTEIPLSRGVFSLPNLNNLVVTNSKVKGDLPSEINPSYSRLETLNLSDNNLSGSIPDKYSEFRSLSKVNLSNNQLNIKEDGTGIPETWKRKMEGDQGNNFILFPQKEQGQEEIYPIEIKIETGKEKIQGLECKVTKKNDTSSEFEVKKTFTESAGWGNIEVYRYYLPLGEYKINVTATGYKAVSYTHLTLPTILLV